MITTSVSTKAQHGFTLLELLIAMTIFAILAVAGWQVFDGLNRAKERAQYHAAQLSELQYAYLQIQQDLAQAVPYRAKTTANGSSGASDINNAGGEQPANSSSSSSAQIEPAFTLTDNAISFVRYADPDPRYSSSPTLIRVEYLFADDQLIRKQFADVSGSAQAVSLDSILIAEAQAGKWQAYLPQMSARFPSQDIQLVASSLPSPARGQQTQDATASLLPRGVGVSFNYYDMLLEWQFALSGSPPEGISPLKPKPSNDPNPSS